METFTIYKEQPLNIFNISVADVAEIPVEEQFFRSPPKDSFVAEGARAIMPCVIGNLGGRVQWTKDGLIMGKLPFCLIINYLCWISHFH